MKILVLTWEFPPRIVGGISRHVAELYPEIVQRGHEVHLVTVEFAPAPAYEVVEGVHVHRVPVACSDTFLHWVANMNESMGFHGGKILMAAGPFDLIHAHDWLVGDAAVALKDIFRLPLLATLHATEYGRCNGIHTPEQHYIHGKEGYLVRNAGRVIVCSQYMCQELERAFACPGEKMRVIYNGIRPRPYPLDFDRQAWRSQYALEGEKLIYYVGRMTYEKGVKVLLQAAPQVIEHLEGHLRIVLIGTGWVDDLEQEARSLGISKYCQFSGFMADDQLHRFRQVADCAVFPSLYEPFGIVVLENFAARVPVVVSNAGGLPEVVRHMETGIVTWSNNPDSLAWGILQVLCNPELGRRLTEQAAADLPARFGWPRLAKATEEVYGQVLGEHQGLRDN